MKQKEIVLGHLKALGFDPVELGGLGYTFNYEEINYLYMPDDDDENFLRIAIPHIFEVNDENRVVVFDAMHDSSLLVKYAKVCIMYEGAVWAIYEHRLTSSDNLQELLEHIIRVLEATAHIFHKKVNGEDIVDYKEEKELEQSFDDELEAELQKLLDNIELEEKFN